MAVDYFGFAMRGSYYTSGVGILINLFGSWGILADAPLGIISGLGTFFIPLIPTIPSLGRRK